MLGSSQLVGFVATTDLDRSVMFYGGKLGLQLIEESPVAHVFNSNGTVLRVTLVEELEPAPYTVLGWTVSDIEGSVRSLQGEGVAFERFEGIDQDELGVWMTPGGDRVAWFKDPDGNVLSLTQVG